MGIGAGGVLRVGARVRRLGLRSFVVARGLIRRTRVLRRRTRCILSMLAHARTVTRTMTRRAPSPVPPRITLSYSAPHLSPGN